MSDQAKFEADYLAAFPKTVIKRPPSMSSDFVYQQHAFAVWQQQAKRHAAEVVELVAALRHISEYWNGSNNEQAMSDACHAVVEIANAAIEKYEVKKS